MKSINDVFVLNNKVKIPCVGYGTYKSAEGNEGEVIEMAIEAGYRHFDSASMYHTEGYIGRAIQKSGIPREEFFITSKIWRDEMGYKETMEAFQRTLANLDTDYLDLYLIHWPLPKLGYENWKELHIETYKAMEELYDEGKIRALGFSNFMPHHIENILVNCRIKPSVNQLEFHPGYTQEAAVRYCQERDILVEAWSPIGRARVLQDPLIVELAQKYEVSPAQICLKYALQRNVLPLPKSSSMKRMKENQDLFSFEISQEDMYRIDTMPQTGWSGEHPERERVSIG